jgi:hypothetical protein
MNPKYQSEERNRETRPGIRQITEVGEIERHCSAVNLQLLPVFRERYVNHILRDGRRIAKMRDDAMKVAKPEEKLALVLDIDGTALSKPFWQRLPPKGAYDCRSDGFALEYHL